jgi:hypothetical protein
MAESNIQKDSFPRIGLRVIILSVLTLWLLLWVLLRIRGESTATYAVIFIPAWLGAIFILAHTFFFYRNNNDAGVARAQRIFQNALWFIQIFAVTIFLIILASQLDTSIANSTPVDGALLVIYWIIVVSLVLLAVAVYGIFLMIC